MGPRAVVEAEAAPDRGPSLEDAGMGPQVDLLVLHGPPEALDEDVVAARAPLPSMLMAISPAISTLMNSVLVNCEPWSVLKISGLPWRTSASSRASMRDGRPTA